MLYKIAHHSDTGLVEKSNYISRDLSWLNFNYRVLNQSKNTKRSIYDRLKFIAIATSNLDEFFMIRIGSLYNYIDYKKDRLDYSGMDSYSFRKKLLGNVQAFYAESNNYLNSELTPLFKENGFRIINLSDLNKSELNQILEYYQRIIHPMLTPMLLDSYHTFPVLLNKVLIFGITTYIMEDGKETKRVSFVQIPINLGRYYQIKRDNEILFLPIEEIIRWQIHTLFRNIEIESVTLFRIIRNGDFMVADTDDADTDFLSEIKKKINTRKTGRVVRLDIEAKATDWLLQVLKDRWDIDEYNIIKTEGLLDLTSLWQIIKNPEFKNFLYSAPAPVSPLSFTGASDIFDYLKNNDVFLHHPYNNMELFVNLLEEAATDPYVLAIKITIYRLANDSRIATALYKAAENGKHVSVLFEVTARFDEENNIQQAQRLQKAGCFVIYGLGSVKTHSKLCLIIRKDPSKETITRYVHLSSGNYNEVTSKLYTDISLLTTDETYANDVSEFFNVITGHSLPENYKNLIAAPQNMRKKLIELVKQEVENHKNGLPSGIVIKVNSLQDLGFIDALYLASNAGVQIKLIVRGICCLRPQRIGVSENITVRSIVGEYLEHARLLYFHNNGNPKVFGGSADAMVRSFDRRIESIFLLTNDKLKQEAINILDYNLKDDVNSYEMTENGDYFKVETLIPFDLHAEFYKVTSEIVKNAHLF